MFCRRNFRRDIVGSGEVETPLSEEAYVTVYGIVVQRMTGISPEVELIQR